MSDNISDFELNRKWLRNLLKSDEVQATLDRDAQAIADKASSMGTAKYRAVKSKGSGRDSAAVLPDDGYENVLDENQNNWLVRAMNQI